MIFIANSETNSLKLREKFEKIVFAKDLNLDFLRYLEGHYSQLITVVANYISNIASYL